MIPPSNPDKPPLESAKCSIEVDMSQAAIDRRLREFFALQEFWHYLRKFRPVNASEPEASAKEG
jgi:hypothetical protein